MVSDGNNVDIILPDSINQTVGETMNNSFAELASEWSACFRVGRNPFRRLLDRR